MRTNFTVRIYLANDEILEGRVDMVADRLEAKTVFLDRATDCLKTKAGIEVTSIEVSQVIRI